MKKGEIWLVELPFPLGHEQTGTRPAIIMSDLEADISIVIPLTSNIQALRFPHTLEIKKSTNNGLETDSIALVFQLRAIDKSRLRKRLGNLETTILTKIDGMIRKLLNI